MRLHHIVSDHVYYEHLFVYSETSPREESNTLATNIYIAGAKIEEGTLRLRPHTLPLSPLQ